MQGLDAAALSAASGREVMVVDRCDSTNRRARELACGLLAAGDLPTGLPVVVAQEQTAGRGRLGRSWDAQRGQNLLFSVVLAPDLSIGQAPRAVLAWAATMAELVGCGLKWPNDLVDDHDRKLGGILTEHEAGPRVGRVGCLILGVGLNVNQQLFPDLPGATSLAQLRGRPLDRQALLIQLLAVIDGLDLSSPRLLDGWRARSRTLGRRVAVAGRTGVATGLRDDGALLVDGSPVLAGDVQLLSP